MSEAVLDIWQTKGIRRGFYAGFGSLVMRDTPFAAIKFPLYELLKIVSIRVIAKRQGTCESQTEIPAVLNSINGSIAGATSGFLTTPLDVMKTRQMTFQTKS